MILPQQNPSIAGRIRVFGSCLNVTKCPQVRYSPCGAIAMSFRGYWHDGSSRRRSDYIRQFKKWADEDFEEYKKREAAFNEHFRNRMEESWPEIKPWLSWALPKEFYNEAFSKSHEHSHKSTHTQDTSRTDYTPKASNRNEHPQQHSSTDSNTAKNIDADRDDPATAEPSFEYDPITMRRVPKFQPRSFPRKTRPDTSSEPISIPVKRFVHPKQSPTREGQVHLANQTRSSAQKSEQDVKESTPPPSSVRQKSKIENALDRHLRNVATPDSPKVTQQTTRGDGVVEDLDNLRANDIRSSPVYQKVTVNGLAKPRKERLNQQYEDHLQHMDTIAAELDEIDSKNTLLRKAAATTASESPKLIHTPPTSMSQQSRVDTAMSQRTKDSENAKKRKEQAIREVHAAEISAQKAFMESAESRSRKNSEASSSSSMSKVTPAEGDMATNVHEFADRGRWYKQRAPSFDSLKQAERRRRDKDLIKEVRGIYEDSYGTIDTRHRHVASKGPESTRSSRDIEGVSNETSANAIYSNREVGRLLQNINTQLIRSVIDMRRLILGAYGKQPVAAKAFVSTEESATRSTKATSPTNGVSSSPQIAAETSRNDGPQTMPKGYTTYKVLSLQGDQVKTIETIAPVENPQVRPARIPDILDHFKNKDQDIEPLIKEVERLHAHGYELCNDENQGSSRIVMRKTLPKMHRPVQQGFYKILTWDSSKEQMAMTITRGSNRHAHQEDIPVPVALHNVRSPELFAPFVAAFQKEGYTMSGERNDLNRWNETNMVLFWKQGPLAEGLEEGTQIVDPQDYISKDGHSPPSPPTPTPAATINKKEPLEETSTPKNFWPNPVDGTLSPTGFVNYESLQSDEPSESDTFASSSSTTPSPLSTHESTSPSNATRTAEPTTTTLSPRRIHHEEPIPSNTIPRPPFSSSSPSSPSTSPPPLFPSPKAASRLLRRAIAMQERSTTMKGRGGKVTKVLKRMVWCGVGLVTSFYVVGLGIRGLWWVGGMF